MSIAKLSFITLNICEVILHSYFRCSESRHLLCTISTKRTTCSEQSRSDIVSELNQLTWGKDPSIICFESEDVINIMGRLPSNYINGNV